jgi:hypothetical protein
MAENSKLRKQLAEANQWEPFAKKSMDAVDLQFSLLQHCDGVLRQNEASSKQQAAKIEQQAAELQVGALYATTNHVLFTLSSMHIAWWVEALPKTHVQTYFGNLCLQ